MKVLAVHDVKAEAFLNPFTMKTAAEGIRAFEATCKDSQSQFAKFPKDYSLVQIGEFNQDTGEITPTNHTILAHASEYVQ